MVSDLILLGSVGDLQYSQYACFVWPLYSLSHRNLAFDEIRLSSLTMSSVYRMFSTLRCIGQIGNDVTISII